MTYCVGLLVKAGLVMIADTRTNAGIDNISIFKKLHILADDADRLMTIIDELTEEGSEEAAAAEGESVAGSKESKEKDT